MSDSRCCWINSKCLPIRVSFVEMLDIVPLLSAEEMGDFVGRASVTAGVPQPEVKSLISITAQWEVSWS